MDDTVRDALDRVYELGFRYEKEYMGCSQCAVAALQDVLGIRNDDIFKAASGFAGGSGLTTEGPCGAFVGGGIILGQLIGRERENFDDVGNTRRKAFDAAAELLQRFEEEFGSIMCKKIQEKIFGRSYTLRDPEDFERFEENGAHVDKCPHVVGRGSQLALEVLIKNGYALAYLQKSVNKQK